MPSSSCTPGQVFKNIRERIRASKRLDVLCSWTALRHRRARIRAHCDAYSACPSTPVRQRLAPLKSSSQIDSMQQRIRVSSSGVFGSSATSSARHTSITRLFGIACPVAYFRTFSAGALHDAAAALRIEALCALGRTAEARAEASTFLRERPHSAVARKVAAACAFE
ncbi:MAG TPA: hypothetical protein VIK91_15420 [Nannocystis sp.]